MLDKLPQGWFRLYGVLQTRALAHGGELLYEVDLSAGGSLMWSGRSLNQKTHTACFCYSVLLSVWRGCRSLREVSPPRKDTACFCYSFDVVLTVNVFHTRSAEIAFAGLERKERVLCGRFDLARFWFFNQWTWECRALVCKPKNTAVICVCLQTQTKLLADSVCCLSLHLHTWWPMAQTNISWQWLWQGIVGIYFVVF